MKKKLESLIFLFLLTISKSWNYEKNGNDWKELCKKENQSPIDISPPFTYKELKINFNYNNMNTEYLLYHDLNNLQLEGDFGYLIYNDEIFSSSKINFYSPSLHSFKGYKYPIELNIIHKNSIGEKIIICIFFKESDDDYSLIFGKIGFDNKDFLNMKPYEKIKIKEQINLSKYLSEEKDFFFYEGRENEPPCENNSKFILLTDVLYINKNQLKNYPKELINKNRNIQNRNNRKIYLTTPTNTIKEKIEENKKIVSEGNKREELNEKMEKMENKTNENGKVKEEKSIKEEGIFDVSTPFDLVKQKVLAKEKLSKKIDINLMTSFKPIKNNSLLIDKDIPLNLGELKRKNIKEKYLIWKNLYKDLIEGIKNNSITELQKNIILFQMKLIEKDLKKENYEPYNKFINLKEDFPLEEKEKNFLKKSLLNSNNTKNEREKKINQFMGMKMYQEELYSPYNKIENIIEKGEKSQGRKPLSEENDINSEIFNITNWPIECKTGKFLSPINIEIYSNIKKSEKKLNFKLKGPNGKNIFVYNDDYKIVIFNNGNFGKVKLVDHEFEVKRFFIHYPSEHTFNEIRSDLEIQMICKDKYENIIAFAFLFEEGENDFNFLKPIFSNEDNFIYTKRIRNNEKVIIENTLFISDLMDLSKIINNNSNIKFASYTGSTTSPSCKSNVKWFVMIDKFQISRKQLNMFPILYGRFSNVRGLQKLNGRDIEIIQ